MIRINLVFIIIFSTFIVFYNDANASTDEVSVNQLYKESMSILKKNYPDDTNSSEKWKDISLATSYAIEIVNRNPRSLEAYLIINSIGPSQEWNNDPEFVKFYLKWRDVILNNLGSTDDNTPEKLIFLRIATFTENSFTSNDHVYENNTKNYFKYLKIMRDECSNKDYAALALVALSYGKNNTYREEFLVKFPDHPAIFLIRFAMLAEKSYDNKYTEYITEVNKLMEQYKTIEMPDGWTFKYDCYSALIRAYCNINEKEKAQKLLVSIEQNFPNYYTLPILKKMINEIGKSREEIINEAIKNVKNKR